MSGKCQCHEKLITIHRKIVDGFLNGFNTSRIMLSQL